MATRWRQPFPLSRAAQEAEIAADLQRMERLRIAAPRAHELRNLAWDRVNQTLDEGQRRFLEDLILGLCWYCDSGHELDPGDEAQLRSILAAA